MEGTQATTSSQTNQAVSTANTASTGSESASSSDEFIATLRSLLGNSSANEVSEEDLFAAIVKDKIKDLKGDEALESFNTSLGEASTSIRRPDGFVSAEDATKEALKALRTAGTLTAEETDSIYSEAFAGAQLDDNKDALFDSRGNESDPTKAVAAMEAALLGVRTVMTDIKDKKVEVTARSVDEASFGHNGSASAAAGSAGGAGFLWKPESDSDGKLAILLPPSLAGSVAGVSVKSPDGTTEEGRFAGNGNGGRDHYRFSKPGGSYADDSVVLVTLNSGEVLEYLIGDTSSRVEDITANGADEVDDGSEPNSGDSSEKSDSSESSSKGDSSESESSKDL